MARKIRRKPIQQHTHLNIRVDSYEASTEASVNHNVYAPQYAWNSNDDDPLYEYQTHLKIVGVSLAPEKRAGETYELIIYGEGSPSHRLNATLKDVQRRDKYGSPQYRKYRNKDIPVYDPPKGLGILEKVRGELRWTSWLFLQPGFASETMTLLGHNRQLFLTIHERIEERVRWIQGLTLQTMAPDEE